MKKVFVVSKTHLDLGFTDFADNVLKKYMNEYIPDAVRLAEEVNTDEKRFVWTTGSWILKKALKGANGAAVRKALAEGNIAPHAMPFTLHTELLDEKSLDYALSVVDELDEITGRKTTAAKMTDVPGHTISLVPILAKHGIKLLHIGVNGASAMPEVPECFLWRHESGAEVVVVYSGSYGGAFSSEYVDEILYFDHTVDNRGARSKEKTIEALEKIKSKYPGYIVEAGRMDDFADAIWEKRNHLPVVTEEIGDTWIHGAATDPYKAGALRELIKLRNEAISSGTLDEKSIPYSILMDNILCLAEHTCGGDSKIFLSDYAHYDKKSFLEALKADDNSMPAEILEDEYGMDVLKKRESGEYRKGSYREIEKTWLEQRQYINNAVFALPAELQEKAIEAIARLRPEYEEPEVTKLCNVLEKDDIKLEIKYGYINCTYKGKKVLSSGDRSPVSYMTFTADDYDCWLQNYTRDFEDNHIWSLPDFCRPYFHNADGKYPAGRFNPAFFRSYVKDDILYAEYISDRDHVKNAGCPEKFVISFAVDKNMVKINLSWYGKEASRIPEATMFTLYPADTEKVEAIKCGRKVDIRNIVEYGNRRLFATEGLELNDGKMKIRNIHSPLCMPGFDNLVRFNNNYPDYANDGISFVLHDSIWGTNFPLWYSDNACFDFELTFAD